MSYQLPNGLLIHESSSHGRISYLIHSDPSRSLELLKGGYRFHKTVDEDLYELRLPELVIIDLGELAAYWPAESIIYLPELWHKTTAAIDRTLQNTGLLRVYGPAIETSIVVAGFDQNQLEQFRKQVLTNTFDSMVCRQRERLLRIALNPPKMPLTKAKSVTKYFLKQARNAYAQYIKSCYQPYFPLYTLREIPPPFIVWNEVKNLKGIKVFAAQACVEYALSYINATTDDNVMLAEIHLESYDPYRFFRTTDIVSWPIVFPQSLDDLSQLLVIDKGYTGNTLVDLCMKLGRYANIRKLTLFPKSRLAIESSDYILFGGRIFDATLVPVSSDWYWQLLLT